MKKGQAFDVFQLMIAAVIAVAILGILLSIIGQIFIPSQRPIQMAQEKLTDAYQYEGAIFTSATKATFQKGESIPTNIFSKNVGAVPITLKCASYIGSQDPKLAECANNQISVQSTFEALISACCTDTGGTLGCYLYVGGTPSTCGSDLA